MYQCRPVRRYGSGYECHFSSRLHGFVYVLQFVHTRCSRLAASRLVFLSQKFTVHFPHFQFSLSFIRVCAGGILGSVASFIIYSNANALVGRSIAAEQLDKINAELESDVMIRAIHDVKGIDMGNSLVRYKVKRNCF